MSGLRVAPSVLESWTCKLLQAAGMPMDKAHTVAKLLVLTDAMGRRTHGVAMLPLYVAEIDKARERGEANDGMALAGDVEVVSDHPSCAVWDARYLPGLWVVDVAITEGMRRATLHGVATLVIRRTHHIGCLAALTKRAADEGFVALLYNADPAGQRVAPFGGKEPLFTPNPYAVAYPTSLQATSPRETNTHPVLVDTCASITTTSMTRQHVAQGTQFEQPWLLDGEGQPTRDPRVLEHTDPRGSLQLTGGVDHGHKGYGQALMIEALTQGLSGHGRADAPKRWGGNVFLQVIDPDFFAGRGAFVRQSGHLAQACRTNAPIDAKKPVRLPGDQAHSNLRSAERDGIEWQAPVRDALHALGQRFNVPLPISA